MDKYLDDLALQEVTKIDGFGQLLKLEGQRAENLKAEAQRLYNKARTVESRIAWLKDHFLQVMQEHGIRAIKGNIYSLGVRTTPVVVTTADLNIIPEQYIRTKTEVSPDKQAIKKALQAGEVIPGCELRESYSLQIR